MRSSRRKTATSGPAGDGAADLPRRLLAWYDAHRRRLPWRAPPGQRPDPYHVWLSEIMLQQTTVATVGPYFGRFIARWPDIHSLAAADLDAVLHGWQGLGYYARARNLHRCARIVSGELGGAFPADEAGLRRLPGIGAYTAAAIAAIAYDVPATAVDGNVERVIARLYGVQSPLPGAKPELAARAAALTPNVRAGDYAQAIMDLGATVCTPRRPACGACPWARHCAARRAGTQEALPRKSPKPERPTRHGVAFWTMRGDGSVLLRRRPEDGLLGGMMEVPTTDWRAGSWTAAAALRRAPFAADWAMLPGTVRHGFTHFRLELSVMTAPGPDSAAAESAGGLWCPVARLDEHALPTLMKKVVRHALAAGPV